MTTGRVDCAGITARARRLRCERVAAALQGKATVEFWTVRPSSRVRRWRRWRSWVTVRDAATDWWDADTALNYVELLRLRSGRPA